MFERFTDRARRVLSFAQEEARLMNHPFIGTEHILLGLVREGEGVAAHVLGELGVTLTAAREEVESIIGHSKRAHPGSPPFTPRAKKVLELSLREALQLGHSYIGTEHLLLGLVREGEGVGVQVLVSLGAEPGRVRQRTIQVLGATRREAWRSARSRSPLTGALRRWRGPMYAPVAVPEDWHVATSSCSLCGRDLWEADHYVEAGEARVCDQCIGSAATALSRAGSEPRALALPPRVFGEVPDAGSVDELVRVVDALVGPAEGHDRREDVVEDAGSLEAQLRELDALLTGSARVSRIRFQTPDNAELRFHFRLVGEDRELTAEGPARRSDGRWVLTRAAVADALERAGVRIPPRGG